MPKPHIFGTVEPLLKTATEASQLALPCPDSRRLIFLSNGPTSQTRPTKDVMILSLAELCNDIVTKFSPDAVVFSLFGQSDDATQIVARLGEIRFRGTCIVLTPPLPCPEFIKAELTSINPALNLELITLNIDRG